MKSKKSNQSVVQVFVDGACRGNPGPGGWGALLQWEGGAREEVFSGAERDTTNNRMELRAAIEALRAIPVSSRVVMTTDSKYVKHGMTEWMVSWVRRGWKTAGGQPVKNVDLWQALAKEVEGHEVTWKWVRGHSGHPGNERADALARSAIDKLFMRG